MSGSHGRAAAKKGQKPGTLQYAGPERTHKVKIEVLDYSPDEVTERSPEAADECAIFLENSHQSWIHVSGVHEVDVVKGIGECFGIHPLVLEDVMHIGQRPKIEDYGDYVFVIVRWIDRGPENGEASEEQVSLILGRDYVISFAETDAVDFEPVRNRIRAAHGRIRSSGSDYLAYALIDLVVDHYFVMLETFQERAEALEDRVLEESDSGVPGDCHALRRDVLAVRRAVWPLREVVDVMERQDIPLIVHETRPFLHDVYDHVMQIMERSETLRETAAALLDAHRSAMAERMNNVMQVLTVVATIFIPLTFIAGVYGMNFQYMPELHYRWAYPAVMLLMLGLAAGMALYFKRKKWL